MDGWPHWRTSLDAPKKFTESTHRPRVSSGQAGAMLTECPPSAFGDNATAEAFYAELAQLSGVEFKRMYFIQE